MLILFFKRIIPETLKTIVLAPTASQASRKVPFPLSSKLVTTNIFPPRPPCVYAPPPSAPGKAGISAKTKSFG